MTSPTNVLISGTREYVRLTVKEELTLQMELMLLISRMRRLPQIIGGGAHVVTAAL